MITQQPPYIAGTVLTHITFSRVRSPQPHQGLPSTSLMVGNNTIRERPPQTPPKRGMGLSKTTESWKIVVWKELEEKLSSLVV